MITSRNSTVVDMLFREFYSSPNFIHDSLSLTLALSSLITTYSHKSAIEESPRTHPFVNHWPVGLSLTIMLSLHLFVFRSIKSLLITLFSFWMIYRWLSLGGYFYFWKLLLGGIYFMFCLVFIIYLVVSNLVYVVTCEFF